MTPPHARTYCRIIFSLPSTSFAPDAAAAALCLDACADAIALFPALSRASRSWACSGGRVGWGGGAGAYAVRGGAGEGGGGGRAAPSPAPCTHLDVGVKGGDAVLLLLALLCDAGGELLGGGLVRGKLVQHHLVVPLEAGGVPLHLCNVASHAPHGLLHRSLTCADA